MIDYTHKQLMAELSQIAQAHYNVRTGDAGVLENLNYGSVQYPLVFFVTDSIEFTPNEMNYNIIMLVADIVDDRYLQQTLIVSNMLEITKDILAYLINGDFDHEWIVDDASILSTPFVDNLPDLTAGIQTTLRIRLPFNNTGCELPFDPTLLP